MKMPFAKKLAIYGSIFGAFVPLGIWVLDRSIPQISESPLSQDFQKDCIENLAEVGGNLGSKIKITQEAGTISDSCGKEKKGSITTVKNNPFSDIELNQKKK